MTDVKLSDIEMRVLRLIAIALIALAVSDSSIGEFVVGDDSQGPLLAFRHTTLQLQDKELIHFSDSRLALRSPSLLPGKPL